jgi:hypothetical protein
MSESGYVELPVIAWLSGHGIPLVIAEHKSYVSSGKDWTEAVHQRHRYQRQAPLMPAPNVFCVAADEDALRYGTVHGGQQARRGGTHPASPSGRNLDLGRQQPSVQ